MNLSPYRDLVCAIDVNEEDLNINGIKLEVNVPSKMCYYISVQFPWHYNFEVGQGPEKVFVRNYEDDSGMPSGDRECFVKVAGKGWYPNNPKNDLLPPHRGVIGTGASCDDLSYLGEGKPSYIEIHSVDGGSLHPNCDYDQAESGGPNCCFGKYDLISETIDNEDSPGDSMARSTKLFQGLQYNSSHSISQCLAGPSASDRHWPKNKFGYPLATVYETYKKGLNIEKWLKGPSQVYKSNNNHELANWYGEALGTSSLHDHFGPNSNIFSTRPIFYDPIEDRSGDVITSGQIPYELRCLNESAETIHRIRLFIREYNTVQAFLNFQAHPINGTQDANESRGGVNNFTDADDFAPQGKTSPPYGKVFPESR